MRITLIALFVCLIQSLNAATYYFSSVSGNDSRTSTQARNSSTPWKSLSKLNSFFSSLQPGDAVLLKRGETFYGSIIVNKSGTSSSPITIGAYGSGDKPVITSLVTLSGWVSKGNGIWESYNSSLGSNASILLINGTEQELGRFPNSNSSNKGYLSFDSHGGTSSITDNSLSSSPNWTGAELVLRVRRWVLDRNLIKGHSGGKITYSSASGYEPRDGYGYFIQNSIKTLDKFGEWYYNPSTKKMSVYFGSNSPSSYKVQVATKDNIIYAYKFSNVVFNNLDIEGANGSGVYIKFGSNLNIQNCDISFSGNNGVEAKFHEGFKIENSTVANSHYGGINMGYSGDYAVIRNNKITNTCVFAGMGESGDSKGVGIFTSGSNSIIEYNQIINTGYVGIFFNGDYVTIKNNLVDNFCITKDDGAGIYTYTGSVNTTRRGRKLIGNIIVNGKGAPEGVRGDATYPAEGIYLDNGASGVELTNNTIANCSNQGVYIHCAHEIIMKGNTIFNNDYRQLSMIELSDHPEIKNCTISNNIFFSKSLSQKVLYTKTDGDAVSTFGSFSSNYYARPVDDKSDDYLRAIRLVESTAKLFNVVNPVRFEYNSSKETKTVSLDAVYMDIKNNKYSGSLTLQPFSSIVLVKTTYSIASTAPSVKITSPSTGSSFKSGTTINITASATDADGSITKVQFYRGSTLMHTESDAPYTYSWSNVPSGNYTLTAKATDNSGKVTTSSSISISVASSKPSNSISYTGDTAINTAILGKADAISDFRLFPNPAVNTIKISFDQSQNSQKANLSIQSLSGTVLKNLPLILSGKTIEVDVSSLSSGVYIMRLTGTNIGISKRFVKINN